MNIGQLAKQAVVIQEKIKRVQERLKEATVEASVGGGMVKVVANGQQKLVSIHIEKEIIKAEDQEMLQDLVLSGVNEALKKATEMQEAEMKKVMPAGMNLPGLNLF